MLGWNHYWNAAAPFIVNMGLSRYDQGVAALGCLDVATSGRTNMYNEAMKEYQKGKLPPDWKLNDLVARCQICFATEAHNKTRVKTHDLVTPQLDRKAKVTPGNSRGASPARSASSERGRSTTRTSPFTLTATPGPDNCTVHPNGSAKGFHTKAQCRSNKSPSRSPGPSNRVAAVVSNTTPLASALKATQKVTENNAQQALSLAETLAANATLTREVETMRQQLKQARNNQQGGGRNGGRGYNGGGRGNDVYGRGGGQQRWRNNQGYDVQPAGGVRNDGRAQHPHVQFADQRGGQQAGIVMEAGNPHMPGGR